MDLIRHEVIDDFLLKVERHPSRILQSNEVFIMIFDLLRAGIDLGNPTLIEPLLDDFYQNDFSDSTKQDAHFLDQTIQSIVDVSQKRLAVEQSQQLISNLLPVYFLVNEYLHQQEIKGIIAQINHGQSSSEQLENSKSDFISIAAHELKTPLTLMEGYSAMLRDLFEQRKIFDEHIVLLIDGMDSGSRRLREIINDMIDVSLIDNELLALSFQPTWLFKILLRVKEQYWKAVQSRQIMLELHRFAGDDMANFFDGERIFQAISNVVSNAIKYTPDGGKIIIDGRQLQDFVEIEIIDNGIGIDPHDQAKIFDKFQAVGEAGLHSSGKLKFKGGGPGLGLPISKGIVEAHGGRIWVESDGYDEVECPGSTFHILLPIREEPPQINSSDLYEPLFFQNPKRS
jgi:signal transduction histidine kinase